ncbi:MAG: hypothetical protein ACE14T_08575 [Syntrophales bacterium]
MKLVENIDLPNQLVAEVWDDSRQIASDTSRVALIIKIRVGIRPEFFQHGDQFELTKRVFGPDVFFEYRKERNFVSNEFKEAVFRELLEDFKKTSLPYISKPHFPARFVLSRFMDIKKHPYKYGLQ